MDYDIIIVLEDNIRWLPQCLASLAAADYDPGWLHVRLADLCPGGEGRETLDTLQQAYPQFASLQISQQPGKSIWEARNAAAKQGEADMLFFLAPDCAISPGLLAEMTDAILQPAVKPAALECRQLPFETSNHIQPATQETTLVQCDALAVRRDAFEDLRGFDPRLGCCANVDFSWRMRAAGYLMRYLPFGEVQRLSLQETEALPDLTLQEYADGLFYGHLLRCKFGRWGDIMRSRRRYLDTAKKPRHYPGVRRLLYSNYRQLYSKGFPLLFWRLRRHGLFKERVGQFGADYIAQRGHARLDKPAGEPLVSVVVRTCQRPDALRETLNSLRNQTYRNFEVVIIEDGKNLSQSMIQAEFADLDPTYHATGKPLGRSKAGNLGLAKAKGEYLNFLDDDDYFYPDHLELMVATALQHPGADLITAASMVLEADVVTPSPYKLQVRRLYPLRYERMDNLLLCQKGMIPIQSVMFKRWLFEEHGGLNEALDGNEDWSMWLKYFSVGKRVKDDGVDITRATSVFMVPAGKKAAQARRELYGQYEAAMLDDPTVRFSVSPREMRRYYDGLLGDLRHLRRIGKLDDFLDGKLDE